VEVEHEKKDIPPNDANEEVEKKIKTAEKRASIAG